MDVHRTSQTNDFLELVFAGETPVRGIWCPCTECDNQTERDKITMSKHLGKYGFTPGYYRWIFHGETEQSRAEVVRQRTGEYDTRIENLLDDIRRADPREDPNSEEPPESPEEYHAALFAAQKPLHAHTEVTQLDGIARLMALKANHNMSIICFNELLSVIASLLPKENILPKNMYESNKILGSLKMPYEQIHACPNGCMLFRNEHKDTNYCVKCKSSRYIEVIDDDGSKRQLTIAVNILRYLSFTERIQRLYMTEETAQYMRWAAEGKMYNTKKMQHPRDGEAWKKFVEIHKKTDDWKSVAVGITTDGFNPYGLMAAIYSCWPVYVIPLNLPPGVCMQRHHMFLTLIIPGPNYPGKHMSVYMEPLVDDLLVAWNNGVRTYDAVSKKHFNMHIWYHTSLHDLPARAIFCGWCVKGKWPCPVCRQRVTFIWLAKGHKYVCFDQHRQFLRLDHPYRQDAMHFQKGVIVDDPPPPIMTGAQLKDELDALEEKLDGKGFVGYGETHQWTHIPSLWRLPYFKDLLLPHNIDVMHTEKNIAEALLGTLLDTEKSKDNIQARIDQAKLCNRPKLNLVPRAKGNSWKKPPAPFTPSMPQRKEILQWIVNNLYFPDGYAANIMRGVNMATKRIGGLKSHDYHVWLERIMPVMIRGYVREDIWRVLAELSYFFRQLCAKELDYEVVAKLEEQAPELLCKLEMIFPPGFFNPMQHMILHLAYEARMGGPVQFRWQYAPEREFKHLRGKCKNKARIEASIAEAYLNEEVATTTTKYYHDSIQTRLNPAPRYNEEPTSNVSDLSLFEGQGGKASGPKPKNFSPTEWSTIMIYVLTNMEEVQPYIK